MPTAEDLLKKLQEIDDLHRKDKKSVFDPLNTERDKKIFYEKSQYVNQLPLPKEMEDIEELLELCQINYQQLENAQKDHLTLFRPQLKDAWQNLAKRIIRKTKRSVNLNDYLISYAKGCGFDPESDNLDPVDIKELKGVGIPKSLEDVKASINITKEAFKDIRGEFSEKTQTENDINNNIELKWHQKPISTILFLIFFFPLGVFFMWKNGNFSKKSRIVVTTVIALLFIFAISDDSKTTTSSSISSSSSYNSSSILVGYDWVYPDINDPMGAWKFSSDGSFNYGTTVFGGSTRYGRWEDVGNNKVKLYYTNGNTQTIEIVSSTRFRVGNTIYRRY